MSESQRRADVLLWGGVLLLVLAVTALALPIVGVADAASNRGVVLHDMPVNVNLPAHQKYGIYVDDTDNSGYSERCTITDPDGADVEQHDPGWSASSSDTESLDIVFNTGSGHLNIGRARVPTHCRT